MHRISELALIGVALLAHPMVGTADPAAGEEAMRSGWYLGVGLGAGRGSDLEQQGWNRDTFCYPTDACFAEDPVPGVSGYRWGYDIGVETGAALELSAGRFLGRNRLELALAQQQSGIGQTFTGTTYYDGSAIRPRPGGTVASAARAGIDRLRLRTFSLDAYRDFRLSRSAVSPYLGAGLGLASVEMAGLHFSIDYRDTTGAVDTHDPPLSFFNSVQNADLAGTVAVWRLHAGAAYTLGRRASLGLKLTWSATGDFEDTHGYEIHPMHALDPAFANTNAFSGTRSLSLMLGYRRRIGE